MAGGVREVLSDSFQGAAMGVMDGTITVLGIVMGVGSATGDLRAVIIAGFVGGLANSIGTSVGFYTSEHAERGQQIAFYERSAGRKKLHADHKYIHSHGGILLSALFGFLAAIIALVLPMSPFFLRAPIGTAMLGCFIIAMSILFGLGTYIGRVNRESQLRSGARYAIIGLVASAASYVVGEGLKMFLG